MPNKPTLPFREAVRGLVLDSDERVLMVRFDFGVWAGPGGGVEPGETHEQALQRELREEVGLENATPGQWLWTREHEFVGMEGYCGQRERIYLVRVPAFEPRPQLDLAKEHITAIRWWPFDEIAASDEEFAPRRLAMLLRDLRQGLPVSPIDVGI